ncbi:hypothetical protein [Gordonibacter sp. Marseille-P4307]|uniref:hypothetical protein n=1 Tax=Gordonibacter sp. Marseille-P4307 TaxID=2161815 RepID=UPI000F5343BC|nr:hypothetical protein [Gordonibacter sp. Marseille-P4307]
MYEKDYLMRQILQFVEALTKTRIQEERELDPLDSARSIEDAFSRATDLDGPAMLSLAPESMASVLDVSGVEPRIVRYLAHGLLLESVYLQQGGENQLADLRAAQARALASRYGIGLPDDPADFSALESAALRECGQEGR